jgi:hypothetical protein
MLKFFLVVCLVIFSISSSVHSSHDCRRNYPVPRPLLSVAITTQGGAFGLKFRETTKNTHRLLRQLWWLSECAERFKVPMEIIVMDWPVERETPLRERILSALQRENLQIPSNVVQLRILEGPKYLTKYNLKTLPVLEYFGKNIAARRSFGKYVLLGGTDALPHEGIFSYLLTVEKNSSSLVCYGAFRQMIESSFPDKYDFDTYVKWRDHAQWRSAGPEPSTYNSRIQPIPPVENAYHWNAAGDFTLCTRAALFKISGYVESSHRTHVDTLFLRHARGCDVELKVFHPSLSAFHQPHGVTVNRAHPFPLPIHQIEPCPDPSPNWGLANEQMREYLFSRGEGKWLDTDCMIWRENPKYKHYSNSTTQNSNSN